MEVAIIAALYFFFLVVVVVVVIKVVFKNSKAKSRQSCLAFSLKSMVRLFLDLRL